MKNLIQAAVVTLFAASTVQAQQAVQWKVSDGGNGHWYGAEYRFRLWADAKLNAESMGGHLATTTSQAELDAIRPLINNARGADYWLGASRATNASPWTWVTGEPFGFTRWEPGAPDNGPESICLEVIGRPESPGFGLWNDEAYYAWGGGNYSVIEWDADCNGDGIVDYGQCRDGTLADYNGNNVPDCCERGSPCVVGSYPVQWRIADGGNGHWYEPARATDYLTWSQAQFRCNAEGASLASLGTQAESDWVYATLASNPRYWANNGPYIVGPWIGGRGPLGNWRWDDGSPWGFAAWYPGEGPPSPDPVEQFAHYFAGVGPVVPANAWGDYFDVPVTPSYVAEWSADCNSDGIVDYGQILQGQVADVNADGVPDICQQPTCVDADIYRDFNVNGADLGILLSQWGPVTQLTQSDLNMDGRVDGADLGFLLANWGPCPG